MVRSFATTEPVNALEQEQTQRKASDIEDPARPSSRRACDLIER